MAGTKFVQERYARLIALFLYCPLSVFCQHAPQAHASEMPILVSVSDVPTQIYDSVSSNYLSVADISSDSTLEQIFLSAHRGGQEGAFEIYKVMRDTSGYSQPSVVSACRFDNRASSSEIEVSPNGRWLVASSRPYDVVPTGAPENLQSAWSESVDRVMVMLLDLTRLTSTAICRGGRTVIDLLAKGSATVAFSSTSNHFLVAVPGAAESQSNGRRWGVTKGRSYKFTNTVGEVWQRTLIGDPLLDGMQHINASFGSSVSLSETGDVISIFIDSGRRKKSETAGAPAMAVPGGWIPETSARSPSNPGILLLGAGEQHDFFEAPRHSANALFAALPQVQGDRLVMTDDGKMLLYGASLQDGEAELHTFRQVSAGWERSAFVLNERSLASCAPSSINRPEMADLALSADGNRLAVLFRSSTLPFLCLLSFDGGSWVLSQDEAKAINAALVGEWPVTSSAAARYFLRAAASLERIFVSDGITARVLDIAWEETFANSLPVWLLYEATKKATP